jgi:hypothetical protein
VAFYRGSLNVLEGENRFQYSRKALRKLRAAIPVVNRMLAFIVFGGSAEKFDSIGEFCAGT